MMLQKESKEEEEEGKKRRKQTGKETIFTLVNHEAKQHTSIFGKTTTNVIAANYSYHIDHARLQALVYDILPEYLEEGAGKRCSQCETKQRLLAYCSLESTRIYL